jgi:hypothetical protein
MLEDKGWLLGAIPVLACLAFLLWHDTRPENFPSQICRRLYARARTVADTAAVDRTPMATRVDPGRTCGDLRAGREILSHP